MKASKDKNWPDSKFFQAKESHLVSKCWTAKQTWFQFVEGWERSRGRGAEGEEKRGRRGTIGPDSHTKMDFLFCPNCISTGSFSKGMERMNLPKITMKQLEGLPDKKENYPSAVRNSISQRQDDNNVPLVAIVPIPSCKRWPSIYKGCSLTGAEHAHTHTRTHEHTRTHTHMHQRPLQYPLGFILASLYGT